MQAETYRRFARHILGDLAERRDEDGNKPVRGVRRIEVVSGEKRRIALRGKNICYAGGEKFRGSDRSFRLTMAVTANERAFQQAHGKARGAHWQACMQTAEVILCGTSKSDGLRQSVLARRRGPKPRPAKPTPPKQHVHSQATATRPAPLGEYRDPRFAELDRLIEEEELDAHKRRQQKRSLPPDVLRLAHVIRVQVHEYRREHKFWEQQFIGWFGAYRATYARDPEWCAEVEPVYRQRMADAEQQLGADDAWTAGATTSVAMLLHEQGKYKEAEPLYVLALQRWNGATTAPLERRQQAVDEIRLQLGECRATGSQGTEPSPDARQSRRRAFTARGR